MKNVLLVWNIILTIGLGYMLFKNTGSSKPGAGQAGTLQSADTSAVKFRIAYLDMDSIETNWSKVTDVKTEQKKKEEEYSTGLTQLDIRYRKSVQEFNDRAKAGTMTKEEYEKGQMSLLQLQDALKAEKEKLDQKYQGFMMTNNLDIKRQIETFLKKYNQSGYYSYILAYDPGFVYFKDEKYNITAQVIKGLNEEYKAVKK